MTKEKDGRVDISVCDPTQLLASMTVRLKGAYKLISSENGMTVDIKDGFARITVACEGTMSAPYKASFLKA
jgi:hypothetical protein